MGSPPTGEVIVPCRTGYALLSVPARRHRLSLRYERFRTDDGDPLADIDPNEEDGSGWTPLVGGPLHAPETLVQVSWRASF